MIEQLLPIGKAPRIVDEELKRLACLQKVSARCQPEAPS